MTNSVEQINTIIKTWCKNRVLKIETRKDDNRRDRKFIVAGSFSPSPEPASDDPLFSDDDIVLQ